MPSVPSERAAGTSGVPLRPGRGLRRSLRLRLGEGSWMRRRRTAVASPKRRRRDLRSPRPSFLPLRSQGSSATCIGDWFAWRLRLGRAVTQEEEGGAGEDRGLDAEDSGAQGDSLPASGVEGLQLGGGPAAFGAYEEGLLEGLGWRKG